VSRELTRAEAALAFIGVMDGGEIVWDLAHGSPGTHWVLKLMVLLVAMVGIAGLEVYRERRSPERSSEDARGAASPPRPGPSDADSD
jgi:hypothetical protein